MLSQGITFFFKSNSYEWLGYESEILKLLGWIVRMKIKQNLKIVMFSEKNFKFSIQSSIFRTIRIFKNIWIQFQQQMFQDTFINDGFDHILWFWEFSVLYRKSQNFRSRPQRQSYLIAKIKCRSHFSQKYFLRHI